MADYFNFGLNQPTADTLDHYLSLEKPQYAVLITGKWGCGKTWFIRKYIEEHERKRNSTVNKIIDKKDVAYCYVSLFGIENIGDVDKTIIAKANPILSGLGKGYGRFGRVLLDQVINRIPIGITTKDVDAAENILKNCFSSLPKNLILILDDLERTNIPIELVLGYATNLLDEVGANLILVYNHEKMSEDKKEVFTKFKEKVVGTTLSISPDFDVVFEEALEIIKGEQRLYKLINECKYTIKKYLDISGSENLRNIKRVIYEISRIYSYMNDGMKENDEYMFEFISIISMFSFENANGIDQNNYKSVKPPPLAV